MISPSHFTFSNQQSSSRLLVVASHHSQIGVVSEALDPRSCPILLTCGVGDTPFIPVRRLVFRGSGRQMMDSIAKRARCNCMGSIAF
jgi:hypothetical protein